MGPFNNILHSCWHKSVLTLLPPFAPAQAQLASWLAEAHQILCRMMPAVRVTSFCCQWHLASAHGQDQEYTVEQWIWWQLALKSAKDNLEASAVCYHYRQHPSSHPAAHSLVPSRGSETKRGENRKITSKKTPVKLHFFTPDSAPPLLLSLQVTLGPFGEATSHQGMVVVWGLPSGDVGSFLLLLPPHASAPAWALHQLQQGPAMAHLLPKCLHHSWWAQLCPAVGVLDPTSPHRGNHCSPCSATALLK